MASDDRSYAGRQRKYLRGRRKRWEGITGLSWSGNEIGSVLSGSEDVAVYPGRTDVDARLKITWKACV
ncbi:hypothetical protein C2845_PM12G03060 [Panicum miliaceum]|uniref:Uncharacterized protein n=1 Tax=Panicum miliaceum TaxID=4540 RepID=A0A3L6QGQ6_PANMI|nr:hypothetical protein C2845_PM12G03060 [Panicum miliaceum]